MDHEENAVVVVETGLSVVMTDGQMRPDHHCEESWREVDCEGQ